MKRRESSEVEQLEDVLRLVKKLLEPVELGARHPSHAVRIIDLAWCHADEWARLADPSLDSERGGSSSPASEDEAAERRAVARMAARGRVELPLVLAAFVRQAHVLADEVARFVMPVDATKLPKDTRGRCQNCVKAGITDSPASSRAPKKGRRAGLCRGCLDFESEYGDVPPVEWLMLRADGRKVAAQRFFTDWLRAREKKSA